MTIQFDEETAQRLISECSRFTDELRRQHGPRDKAATDAATDFKGGYGTRFGRMCGTESQDRGRLAGALEDLAQLIEDAIVKAEDERARLARMEAWSAREEARFQRHAASGGSVPISDPADPMPTEPPVAPPEVGASFTASARPRTAVSSSSGVSSAAPFRLDACASTWERLNGNISDRIAPLRSAWSAFTSTCGWVRIGSATFLSGSETFLSENERDAQWLRLIAHEFRNAGFGSLSDAELDRSLAVLDEGPEAVETRLEELEAERRAQAAERLGTAFFVAKEALRVPSVAAKYYGNWKYARFAPRGTNGRFVKHAETRFGRGLQAKASNNWASKPGKVEARAFAKSSAKLLGRVTPWFSGGAAAMDQWASDERQGYSTLSKVTRSGITGVSTGAGSFAGAAVGTKVGAAIGVIGGPAGVVVGGIVGGIIGSLLGGKAGEAVGKTSNSILSGFGLWG